MNERSLYANNNNDTDSETLTRKLFFAAKEGDIDKVTLLLNNHALKVNDRFPVYYDDNPEISLSEINFAEIMLSLSPSGKVNNLSNAKNHLNNDEFYNKSNGSCVYITALFIAAFNNHLQVVDKLVNAGAKINDSTLYGTALEAAVMNGAEEVVLYLLNLTQMTVNKENWSQETLSNALFLACQSNQPNIVRELLRQGAPLCEPEHLLLHMACGNGSIEIAKLLIAYHANVNLLTKSGDSPLHYACRNGHTDIIELLLHHGANVNAQNLQGETPLYIATNEDSHAILSLLLAHPKIKVNIQGPFCNTAFSRAAVNGNLKTGSMLLAHGADINIGSFFSIATRAFYVTPLYFAAYNKHSEFVKFLLENKAEFHASSISPFEACSAEIAKMFEQHGYTRNNENSTILARTFQKLKTIILTGRKTLFVNIKNNHFRRVEKLLQANVNPNYLRNYQNYPINEVDQAVKKDDEISPLHLAVIERRYKIIKLLNTYHADFNIQTSKYKQTALHTAVLLKDKRLIKILLENPSTNPNLRDYEGNTPLSLCFDDEQITQMLLDAGADPNIPNHHGATPLHHAAFSNKANVLRKLLDKGAKIDLLNKNGMTALLIACRSNASDAIQVLLERNADVDLGQFGCTDKFTSTEDHAFNCTPVLQAVFNGNVETLKTLLAYHANPDSENLLSPVAQAILHKDPLLLKILLMNGAKKNCCYWNIPYINLIIHTGCNLDLMEAFLFNGSSNSSLINTVDASGNTPLHLAVRDDNPELVSMLVQEKANPNKRNQQGSTPLHLAVQSFNKEDKDQEKKKLELKKKLTIVKSLLEANADTNSYVHHPFIQSPFILALFTTTEQPELVELMLKYGNPNVNMPGYERVAFNYSIHNCSTTHALFDKVLATGKCDKITLNEGLNLAVWLNRTDLVKKLLQSNADPNYRNDSNSCIIHIAIKKANIENVALLIDAGANLSKKNENNQTAFELCEELLKNTLEGSESFINLNVIKDLLYSKNSMTSIFIRHSLKGWPISASYNDVESKKKPISQYCRNMAHKENKDEIDEMDYELLLSETKSASL